MCKVVIRACIKACTVHCVSVSAHSSTALSTRVEHHVQTVLASATAVLIYSSAACVCVTAEHSTRLAAKVCVCMFISSQAHTSNTKLDAGKTTAPWCVRVCVQHDCAGANCKGGQHKHKCMVPKRQVQRTRGSTHMPVGYHHQQIWGLLGTEASKTGSRILA